MPFCIRAHDDRSKKMIIILKLFNVIDESNKSKIAFILYS